MDSVDVVVNFAAESHVDRSIESSAEFVKTNVLGTENLLAHALMLKTKVFIQISTDEVYGSIDNGSWKEDSPLKPNSPYSASKAAVHNLSKNLAREWADKDIRVNTLVPGFFPAEQNRKVLDESRVLDILRQTPASRFGNADELIGATLLLASSAAGSFITGHEMIVDGGFHAMTI
jgi:NAD(P)-dependent dehydrogenase (short-subunit alcohol dehydrogenase family)